MEKKNKTTPWSEEEITLLKFYYAFKDKFSWNEISDKMKVYTNIERTSTALMTKIDRLKKASEKFDKFDMKKLYDEIVLTRKNGIYSYHFKKYIINNFSKYFGTPDEIAEDTALIQNNIPIREDTSNIVETMVDFDKYHTEDGYSDFKLSDYIYHITLWMIGLVVACILLYLGINFYNG